MYCIDNGFLIRQDKAVCPKKKKGRDFLPIQNTIFAGLKSKSANVADFGAAMEHSQNSCKHNMKKNLRF